MVKMIYMAILLIMVAMTVLAIIKLSSIAEGQSVGNSKKTNLI
jgi:hypothetical protein